VPRIIPTSTQPSYSTTSTGEIKFYDRSSPYYEFTNFYPAPITLEGKLWPTSEHYFQAQKFVSTPYMEIIRKLSTPREAFQMAREPSVSQWKRKDWEDVKDDVMLKALRCKFTQHTDLGKKLVETHDKCLVEHTANDSYWADGGDGSGQNKLGKLLMQVRSELQASGRYCIDTSARGGSTTFSNSASSAGKLPSGRRATISISNPFSRKSFYSQFHHDKRENSVQLLKITPHPPTKVAGTSGYRPHTKPNYQTQTRSGVQPGPVSMTTHTHTSSSSRQRKNANQSSVPYNILSGHRL